VSNINDTSETIASLYCLVNYETEERMERIAELNYTEKQLKKPEKINKNLSPFIH